MADFESSAPQHPNSNYLLSLPPSPSLDPPPPPIRPFFPFSKRPAIRVTTEFDSESSIFFHKVSCKLLENLAKIKLSFQNDNKGQITDSQLQFHSKYLSIHYSPDEHNALLRSSIDVGPRLHFHAAHDIKVFSPAFFRFQFVLFLCFSWCPTKYFEQIRSYAREITVNLECKLHFSFFSCWSVCWKPRTGMVMVDCWYLLGCRIVPLCDGLWAYICLFQAQQGELGVVAKIADPGYSLELSSPVPSIGMVSFSELGILTLSGTPNIYMDCTILLSICWMFLVFCHRKPFIELLKLTLLWPILIFFSQEQLLSFPWVKFHWKKEKRRKWTGEWQLMVFLKGNFWMAPVLLTTRMKNWS